MPLPAASDVPSTPDTAPTPASEHSVYFDAPIMHFFTRKNDEVTSPTPDTPQPQQDSAHQPSVAIAPDPVVNRFHENLGADDDQPNEDPKPVGSKESTDSTRRVPSPHSDSGYGSSSPTTSSPITNTNSAPQRTVSYTSRASMKSVPVVWNGNPPADAETAEDGAAARGRPERRATSMRSLRTSTSRHDLDRDTIRSSSASRFSERRRGVSLSGGSFAGGAGTIGPHTTPGTEDTENFLARTRTAEEGLTPKQKSKIEKAAAKEGKRLSKVLKSEAKAEAKALGQATHELADIQKMQKTALKEESRAVAQHSKALRTFHKDELEFLAARVRFEKAQAELAVVEDARDAARDHAREVTDMLQEKNREVEWLRAQKAADDRERQVKIAQLTTKS